MVEKVEQILHVSLSLTFLFTKRKQMHFVASTLTHWGNVRNRYGLFLQNRQKEVIVSNKLLWNGANAGNAKLMKKNKITRRPTE